MTIEDKNHMKAQTISILVCIILLLPGCTISPFGSADGSLVIPDDATSITSPMADVPMFPVIEASINGQPGYRFLLDTGAGPTAIFLNEKTKHLDLKGHGTIPVGGVGNGPRPRATVIRNITLAFNEFTIEDKITHNEGYSGLVGIKQRNGYRVTSINPESPAEQAGVTPSVYKSLNGQSIIDLSWAEINIILKAPPDQTIELCKGIDENYCYTVTLADLTDPPKL